MANIVEGLFGLSPFQVQQQQQAGIDARANTYANQDPFARATAGMYRAGAGIAGIGAGMMGMVNPQLEEAKQVEGIQSQIDHQSADGLMRGAQMFNQAGNPQMSTRYVQAAQAFKAREADSAYKQAQAQSLAAKAKEESSPFAKIPFEKATHESRQKFLQTRNLGDLEFTDPADKISAWGQQLVDAGYTPGTPEFNAEMRKRLAADLTGSAKGSGATIVNQMPGQKEFKDIPAFRAKVQGTIKPQLEMADEADSVITILNQAMKDGNFSSFNAAKQILARVAGSGSVARSEVLAAGADPSILGGLADQASTLFTGTPTKDTIKKMIATSRAFQIVARRQANTEIGVQKKMAKGVGFSQEDTDMALDFPGLKEKGKATEEKTGTSKSGKPMIFRNGQWEYL